MSLANPYPATLLLITTLLFGLLTGCEQPNQYIEPPPPTVTVAQPVQQKIVDYLEFTGTTQAVQEVEVRARVSGFLESMHFTPGTTVEEGELLFVIDPREYQAELEAARAELESAKAQFERAQIEFDRAERLFKEKAGSEADVVKWRGERDIAKAAIARTEAQVERAELNLGYTQVTAPINGRVARNRVDVGNLVGEGEPTLLTTVTQYDPIYAYFNLNERDLLRVMETYRERVEATGVDPKKDSVSAVDIPLYLGLANEEDFPHEGEMDFAESGVDPGTGTLQLRGIFPNPGRTPSLLPGLFTRIRLPIDERDNALLVSERALGADQSGKYLLAVNSENVVEKRAVRPGQSIGGMVVIEEGVRADDWVVVNGLQRARPGGKVDPERTEMASLTTAMSPSDGETTEPETPSSPNKPASAGSEGDGTAATEAMTTVAESEDSDSVAAGQPAKP